MQTNDIETSLWSTQAQTAYPEDQFHAHLLEQYKTCLQMADRISDRRANANTFFLTFHTALIGALAALQEHLPSSIGALYFAAILICGVWWWILRSYRNLNTAKFQVIGLMEKRLPSSPFYAAEWKALGEGKNWRVHIPLTPIEQWIPIIFAGTYVWLALSTSDFIS